MLARASGLPKPEAGSRKPELIQNQVDHLVSHFVEEASDWRTLAAMVAGSLAYRFARVGVVAAGSGHVAPMPLRWMSVGLGLGAEVMAFEGTNRFMQTAGMNLATEGSPGGIFPLERGGRSQGSPLQTLSPNFWAWSGPGGLGQGLLSSFITFGMLKGAGFLGREQNIIFQHAFQSTTMVAGHQLAAELHIIPRPEGSLPEQFLHAEATNLQMMAGMGLVQGLAPGISTIEKGLDFSSRRHEGEILNPFVLQTVPAGVSFSPRPQEVPLHFFSQSTKEGGLLPKDKAQALTAKYRHLFPPESQATFSDAIVAHALSTPGETSHFHERLLEAYAQVPVSIRGTREQLFTVHAIKRIFEYDPLRTGTGSFENSLLQLFLSEALRDARPGHRGAALQELFQGMEAGLSRVSLYRLFSRFGYGRNLGTSTKTDFLEDWVISHRMEIKKHLGNYREEDQAQWIDFLSHYFGEKNEGVSKVFEILGKAYTSGRYEPADIDHALDYAKTHPMGQLVLHRILQVFAIEDHPVKLKELHPERPSDTALVVSNWFRLGLDSEMIARSLNGTRHTAYLNDLRLARKVVSVYGDLFPFLRQSDLRNTNKRLLREEILDFLHSGKPLSPEEIVRLLQTNPDPTTHPLQGTQGPLEIKILTGEKFDEAVGEWGEAPLCEYAFLGRTREAGSPYRIYIREMPPIKRSSVEGLNKAFTELSFRLMAVVHEAEHWRHFTGNYEGMEKNSESIVISQASRHERLVSEIMASLEEQRWTLRNIDQGFYEISRRFGENLPLFYRSLNDHGLYHRTNQRLTRELGEAFLKKVFFTSRGFLF